MIQGIDAILIFSENPRKLAEFYQIVVGLELNMEIGDDEEKSFALEAVDGSSVYIGHHSMIKGTNKEPERMMINFETDDIEDEVERLQNANVKLIQDIYTVEGYGDIATFEDPDGNYFQIVQIID